MADTTATLVNLKEEEQKLVGSEFLSLLSMFHTSAENSKNMPNPTGPEGFHTSDLSQ